jgi:transposase-like protein
MTMTLPKQVKQFFNQKVAEFLFSEDLIHSMLQWLLHEFMRAETETIVGSEKNKHSKERKTYFSGYRTRRFDTRLGTIYLLVPKLRNGGYVPFFLQEKKRSETALISLVREAYVNGVSTRKMDRLAKSLGIVGLSASQVSELTKGLNQEVSEWRNRPLEASYPVIWVDALYEKIRHDGRVINSAVLVIQGLNSEGKRDVLAIEPMLDESEASWTYLFDRLKARGLEQVWLVVSDAHKGIQAAVTKSFLGSQWQRCKVHFMRNILAHIKHRAKGEFAAKLKQIWCQPDIKSARKYAENLVQEYEERLPEATSCLLEGLEDSLQYFHFGEFDYRKISSTNTLERLNAEIRRRTRVVGIFPSMDSYVRLVTTYMIEYTEDWMTSKAYFSEASIMQMETVFKERKQRMAA